MATVPVAAPLDGAAEHPAAPPVFQSKKADLETVGESEVQEMDTFLIDEEGFQPPVDSLPLQEKTSTAKGVDSTKGRYLSDGKQAMECVPAKQREVRDGEHLPGMSSDEKKNLASKPSTNVRAVVDTAAPFESVKEAVSLFEERMDWKQAQSFSDEGGLASDFDTEKVYDEIVLNTEQIRLTKSSLIDILLELENTNKQIQLCRGKVSQGMSNGEASDPLIQPEEAMNVSIALKEVHLSVEDELQMTKQEIERVKEEHSLLVSAKIAAVKGYEASCDARDAAIVRVGVLNGELASANRVLSTEQEALNKARTEIDKLDSAPRNHTESSMKGSAVPASDAYNELTCAQLRLEQVKAAEGNHVAALGRVLEEVDELKANLSKATADGASVASALCSLQSEVARCQSELQSAHETEQIACATLASLQDELCSVRALVMAAEAGESKAREAKRILPSTIKQLAAEADEAKAASMVANEEIRKAKLELEQVMAAMSTTKSWLQVAQEEAKAARLSETMLLAELKALSESEAKLAGLGVESKDTTDVVTLSLEEYQALILAVQEAEEAANKKVVEPMVLVEAAKASQQGAQEKFNLATKEAEAAQKELEQAQKKADDAHGAKLEIEAKLRKWRAEHEQWRKISSATPSSVSSSAVQSPSVNGKPSGRGGRSAPLSFQGKTLAGMESLTEVLSLKVPSSERVTKTDASGDIQQKAEKGKKKSFFARIMSLVTIRRKSKSMK